MPLSAWSFQAVGSMVWNSGEHYSTVQNSSVFYINSVEKKKMLLTENKIYLVFLIYFV